MAGFKMELNVPGFNEVRNDPAILADLLARGERIASAAGGGDDFEVVSASNKTRARVIVRTSSYAGMRAEAEDRVLTQAFDAGRG